MKYTLTLILAALATQIMAPTASGNEVTRRLVGTDNLECDGYLYGSVTPRTVKASIRSNRTSGTAATFGTAYTEPMNSSSPLVANLGPRGLSLGTVSGFSLDFGAGPMVLGLLKGDTQQVTGLHGRLEFTFYEVYVGKGDVYCSGSLVPLAD